MTVSARSAGRALCGIVIVVLAADIVAAKDDAFKDGLKERNKPRDNVWTTVAAKMTIAIKEGEDADRQVDKTAYVPYFFLGEALFRIGDCVKAMEAWKEADRLGIARKSGFGQIIDDGTRTCVMNGFLHPDEFEAALKTTDKEITDANQVAERVSNLERPLWDSHSEWRGRYNEGRDRSDAATRAKDQGAKSHQRKAFTDAQAEVSKAVAIWSKLELDIREASRRKQDFKTRSDEAARLIDEAETAEQSVDAVGSKLPRQFVTGRDEGKSLLSNANTQIVEARRTEDVSGAIEAGRLASGAKAKFKTVTDGIDELARNDLTRRRQLAANNATTLLGQLDELTARVETRLGQQPASAPPHAAADLKKSRADVTKARRQLQLARQAETIAPIEKVQRGMMGIRDRLIAILGVFGPLTLEDRGVPTELQKGLQHFLQGEYAEALTVLEPAQVESFGVMSVHAYVIRAAALYTQFVAGGEKNVSLKKEAEAAAQAARTLQPDFRPDPRVFSKRFIAFYQGKGTIAAENVAAAHP